MYKPGRRIPHAIQDQAEVNTWKQNEKSGLWEADFVVAKGYMFSGSHVGMWLACLNNSVSWQGTETCYSETSGNCTWSIWRTCYLARESFPSEQSGEENLQLGHLRPSYFHLKSRLYMILERVHKNPLKIL